MDKIRREHVDLCARQFAKGLLEHPMMDALIRSQMSHEGIPIDDESFNYMLDRVVAHLARIRVRGE